MGIMGFIALSAAVMMLLMFLRRRRYGISGAQSLIVLGFVIVVGMAATRLMYFIENGGWLGRSFFGAVLFLPIFLIPFTKLLRMPYHAIMDLVSLPGLAMFAIMKYNCYVQDCCGGIVIGYTAESAPIFFPSQLVETFVTILVIIVLLVVECGGKVRDRLYPVSMIVYGVVRFVLNWFRWDNSRGILWMPKGNFWAILCTVIGIVWLVFLRYQKSKNNEGECWQGKEVDSLCR